MIDLAKIKTEIQTDPQTIYPAAPTGSESTDWDRYYAGVADLMNDPAKGGGAISRESISTSEFASAVLMTDVTAMTVDQRFVYEVVRDSAVEGEIDITAPNTRDNMGKLFGDGTGSKDAMIALLERPGSRTEIIHSQEGLSVIPSDVARALTT